MAKRGTSVTPDSFQNLGELINFLRERAHLTQRDLAARVDYHYSYISRVEKNLQIPAVATLMGRFIPALDIEGQSEWIERLIELASGKPKDSIEPPDEAESTIPEIDVYKPQPSFTSILGREKESEQVIEILLREEVRILTIVGPPGVGKTRLSLHIADQLAKHFSNGVVFVDLTSIPHFAMVLTSLAEALGVQETSTSPIQLVLETFLQKRQILIIFDNFEQVLPAAPALLGLLSHAPQIKMLITSREALRVPGEHEFQLDTLPLPGGKKISTKDLMTSPAIQLFVQRATAVKSAFQLTEENASLVTEICRRLDGLPLAIELAAARIQTLNLEAMLDQFDRRFSWLTRGRSDMPAWRQTLSGAITWSYQLLTEPEKALFQRLAVFEGGWDLEAAEKICSDNSICPPDQVFNLLLRLFDRSLIAIESNDKTMRYRFLETIRHFALEKFNQSNENNDIHDQHLNYFTEWVEQMEAIINKMPPLEFRQIIEKEHSNIRAALEWSLTHELEIENGLRLTNSICAIWLKHSHFNQVFELAETFMPHTKNIERKNYRAKLLYLKSASSYWRDNLPQALESGLKSEALSRELDDKRLLANVLAYLGGNIYREIGEQDKAKLCLEESIALCRETQHWSRLSISLTGLGAILFIQNMKEESRNTLQEALQVAEYENDQWGQSYALRMQADHLRVEEKFEAALETYQRTYQISRTIEDRITSGMALANMSLLTNVLGDFKSSEEYAHAALHIFEIIGNEYQAPFPNRMLAYAALHHRDIEAARMYAKESLKGNQAISHKTGMLASLIVLTEIELAGENSVQSMRLFSFVKVQLEKESINLMEPDVFSLKRLTSTFLKNGVAADLKQIQKEMIGLSIDEIIQELNLEIN